MSRKLALSSALSVLLMAGFTLFGEQVARDSRTGVALLGTPGESLLPRLPALPQLPGLR